MSNTSAFTLDKKTKAEWIAALRSKGYAHGANVMYNKETDAYCCLGVLCAVEGKSRNQLKGKTFPFEVGVGEHITDNDGIELFGPRVFKKLTFDHNAGELTYAVKIPGMGWTPLSHLNDNECYSFESIADIVEKYVETHD